MTGIQYVKNEKGETTYLLVDWKLHKKAIQSFLEDLDDIQALKKTENEALISFSEVRDALLEKGVAEEELVKFNVQG